jgi:hypothetical protein
MMRLGESEGLLGESARYFVCLYEHFGFNDQQSLKDYLDFIVHEPVEFLKAFPEQLKTKSSFAKPKSALIKLLKHERVINLLGEEYIKTIHDTIWATFKKHGDSILSSRQKQSVNEDEDNESDAGSRAVGQKPTLHIQDSDIDNDAISVESVVRVPNSLEKRCVLLTNLVRTLVRSYEGTCPALAAVTLQLLDEISAEKNEIV